MTKYMRFLGLLILFPALAYAAVSPVGEWQVADGTAHIRMLKCDNKLWGIISWVKEPGTDSNNPDPAKRARPMVGVPIVLGMPPLEPNRWGGAIYNSDNGKTYSGTVALTSDDNIHIEGCVLGVLCGGEDWKRIKMDATDFPCPH